MKKLALALLVLSAAFTIGGCADAHAGSSLPQQQAEETQALAESQIAANLTKEVEIFLSDQGSSATDSSVTISGSTVIVTQRGDYRITGSLSDGQIVVKAEDTEKVKLILDGVQISKEGSAAIYAVSADKLVLASEADQINRLESTGSFVQTDENNVDAVIFAKCDLNLDGEGQVEILCETGHGVVSKDDLKVKDGSWTVSSAGKGLSGKDSFTMDSGDVTVESGGKGVWSGNEEDAEKGVIAIAGGNLTIRSEDDGIHSDNTINISGGELSISSGDDGIHADNKLTILDGSIRITQSWEGLEAQVIDIQGGEIHILATDDGINAAGGNDGSNDFGQFGADPFASDSGSALSISGGTLVVDAGGDGLDVNGALSISGGEVYVSGPTDNGNGALDYGTNASITGGTIIAAGSGGMAENFGSDSTQGSILLHFSSAQAAGTTVSIADESGKVLASFAPGKSYQAVVISTAGMEQGGTYTVNAGSISESIYLEQLIYGNGRGFGGPGNRPSGAEGQMPGSGGVPAFPGSWKPRR